MDAGNSAIVAPLTLIAKNAETTPRRTRPVPTAGALARRTMCSDQSVVTAMTPAIRSAPTTGSTGTTAATTPVAARPSNGSRTVRASGTQNRRATIAAAIDHRNHGEVSVEASRESSASDVAPATAKKNPIRNSARVVIAVMAIGQNHRSGRIVRSSNRISEMNQRPGGTIIIELNASRTTV